MIHHGGTEVTKLHEEQQQHFVVFLRDLRASVVNLFGTQKESE